METKAGFGCEKTIINTETRQKELIRKDVQMGFDITGNELCFRLQYQPYYKAEQREIVKYTPKKSPFKSKNGSVTMTPKTTLLEWPIFLVEGAAWCWALGRFPTKVTGTDDTGTSIDWEAATAGQKTALIGITSFVALDWLLYFVAANIPSTKSTPWYQIGTIPGTPEPIINQPYQISLSDYGLSKTYRTQSDAEKINLYEFASNLSNSPLSIGKQPIEARALTTIDGKSYQRMITISDSEVLQNFRNLALGVDTSLQEDLA
jgi:hypothetical protein